MASMARIGLLLIGTTSVGFLLMLGISPSEESVQQMSKSADPDTHRNNQVLMRALKKSAGLNQDDNK